MSYTHDIFIEWITQKLTSSKLSGMITRLSYKKESYKKNTRTHEWFLITEYHLFVCALFRVRHPWCQQNHWDAVFKQMCHYTIILNTPITNSHSIHANNHTTTGKEALTRRLTVNFDTFTFNSRNHKFRNLQFFY